MKKHILRGFTLIELLVVIAIIGILASVVLASLNSARNKGADAAVKASLSNARAQAELFYDGQSPNTYAAVCASGTNAVGPILLGAVRQSADADGVVGDDAGTTATTAVCNDSAAAWASEMPLKSGGFYCVDSTGKSQQNANAGLADGSDYSC